MPKPTKGVRACFLIAAILLVLGGKALRPDEAAAAAFEFTDQNWMSMGAVEGANNNVRAAATDGFGNLYIGGDFSSVGGISANRVAKWDGRAWSALGSGLDATVSALAVSGSNLYAGGYFTNSGGTVLNQVAKWDGVTWTALGSGLNDPGDYVTTLAASGSELYAGGLIYTVGGQPAQFIA